MPASPYCQLCKQLTRPGFIQIDDAEDVDVIELLIDPQPVDGFDVVTTETVPGTADSTKPGHVQVIVFFSSVSSFSRLSGGSLELYRVFHFFLGFISYHLM